MPQDMALLANQRPLFRLVTAASCSVLQRSRPAKESENSRPSYHNIWPRGSLAGSHHPAGRPAEGRLAGGGRAITNTKERFERMEQVIVDLVNNFPADGEGEALRSLLDPHQAKALRSACVKLKLNPQSRTAAADNKRGYIELLLQYHRDKADGEFVARTGPSKKQRKQTERRVSPHDIFLLVNIVFSDEFLDRMSEADKNQTRAALDTGAINDRSPYWRDVTRTYDEDRDKYKGLVTAREQYQGIHPDQAVPHSASKLMDMWKTLTSRYAVVYMKSKSTGQNDIDFFNYCKGRVDVLYLHDWLQVRPNQLTKVCGRVTKEAQMSTLEGSIESDSSTSETQAGRETGNKRRRRSTEGRTPAERLVDLVEEEREEEKATRDSGYEVVTRSSIAAQNAMKTLKMMKDIGASEELVIQAQQQVDAVVKRWMNEMATMQ